MACLGNFLFREKMCNRNEILRSEANSYGNVRTEARSEYSLRRRRWRSWGCPPAPYPNDRQWRVHHANVKRHDTPQPSLVSGDEIRPVWRALAIFCFVKKCAIETKYSDMRPTHTYANVWNFNSNVFKRLFYFC